MKQTLKDVTEFHRTFGVPVGHEPNVPPIDRIKLRLTLILEELHELAQASGAEAEFIEMMDRKVKEYTPADVEPDPVEVIDALCDLQVVLNGSIIEYGFQHEFDEAFEEVHQSNMSKACDTEEEGRKSIEKYKEEGVPVILEPVNGKFILYRTPDYKVMKNVNWRAPSLIKYTQHERGAK